MTATRKNIEFAKVIAYDRQSDPYVYGGNWDPFNKSTGTDCSGCVVDELDAALNGTAMAWSRHGLSTEDWRPPAMGGSADPDDGPFGTVMVDNPSQFPANAAVLVALHHGPGGGENSHMWCQVDTLAIETNGDDGTVLGSAALSARDTSYANNWWYLPGPIIEDGTPLVTGPSGGTNVTYPRGLDYAGSRIAAADLKANGIAFVCRYLTDGGSGLPGKQLLPNEFADLQANGIGVVFNWETTSDFMLAGAPQGTADASAALAYVQSLPGAPQNPVIYFSADFDATEDNQVPINAYLAAAAVVLGGPQYVGIYGGYWPLSRALDAGVCQWAWQTIAWSGTNVDSRINILQRNDLGYQTIDGVQCDINEAHTDNYGQAGAAAPAPTPDPAPAPAPAPESNPPAIPKPTTAAKETAQIWDQLLLRWDMLNGDTLVEAIARIGHIVGLPYTPPS